MIRKVFLITLALSILFSISGCVCAYNIGFDDLSYEEQQEVLQSFSEVKVELNFPFCKELSC